MATQATAPARAPERPSPRRRVVAAALLLLAGIAVLPLAALEAGLRLFRPQEVRVVESNAPDIGIHDDQVGQLLRPGARLTVAAPEYKVEYTINQEGMRDERTHTASKPAGVQRVLLVGDSFTFGDANHYQDIWPVEFERRAGSGVEVIKAGVPGYDTRSEAIYLARLLPRYKPDAVLLTFLPNDLFTNRPSDTPARGRRAEETGVGAKNRFELHATTWLKGRLIGSDYLYARIYMLTQRRQYFAAEPNEHVRRQTETTKALLKQAADSARAAGATFAVASIPQSFQVYAKARGYQLAGVDPDRIDRELGEFAAANGFRWIPLLDRLTAEYKATGEELYLRIDGHLTARGNRKVGQWLAEDFAKGAW